MHGLFVSQLQRLAMVHHFLTQTWNRTMTTDTSLCAGQIVFEIDNSTGIVEVPAWGVRKI